MDVRVHKVYDLKDVANAHEVSEYYRDRALQGIVKGTVLMKSRTLKAARLPASFS